MPLISPGDIIPIGEIGIGILCMHLNISNNICTKQYSSTEHSEYTIQEPVKTSGFTTQERPKGSKEFNSSEGREK